MEALVCDVVMVDDGAEELVDGTETGQLDSFEVLIDATGAVQLDSFTLSVVDFVLGRTSDDKSDNADEKKFLLVLLEGCKQICLTSIKKGFMKPFNND